MAALCAGVITKGGERDGAFGWRGRCVMEPERGRQSDGVTKQAG